MSTLAFDALKHDSRPSLLGEIRVGLTDPLQKWLPPACLYDAIGSRLFDAITELPEYGLTRADQRLLSEHAFEIRHVVGNGSFLAELGSGGGLKTRVLLEAFASRDTPYYPIDISRSALDHCAGMLNSVADVRPVEATYIEGLRRITAGRRPGTRMLLLFLGSSIGNFSRRDALEFLSMARAELQSGDYLLIGADLVKPVERMLLAYDDPTGITAAFNRNVLARLNREFGANFDLHAFDHDVRWRDDEQRIEMHLRAQYQHSVRISDADLEISLRSGETIWTESSHKFTRERLEELGIAAGFAPQRCWVDEEWPFANCLWRVSG